MKDPAKLTTAEETLLRKLILRGDQEWTGINREAVDGLQALGYAKRTGNNGYGRWASVTPRGMLKALASGMISHHPEDPEPVAAMLRKDRVRAVINR